MSRAFEEPRSSTVARALALALTGAVAAGCAAPPRAGDPAAAVRASGETVAVATVNDDAADDPAIWRDPRTPAASLLVGTDKKAGVYVYGLDGAVRHFEAAGRLNNVDLRDGVRIGTDDGVLVAASDRNDASRAQVALFRLEPSTGMLRPLGRVAAGDGEAYGLCLYRDGRGLYAFVVLKDGTIRQVALDLGGPAPAARTVRTLKLSSQSEGCAADERTGRLYVGEEAVGLWRFEASERGPTAPVLVAPVDGRRLVADVEGVAVAPTGADGGYLVVSSQGDNAFAVWRLPDESYLGRFRIAADKLGAVEETDGIELVTGDLGPAFPAGLFVAQDGRNAPSAQNFKLVAWRDVETALGLR